VDRLPRGFWWVLAFGAVAAAYLPGVGRGFIKDDFAWIAGSRFAGALGWLEPFRRHNGFYRPLVSLSFAADERLFGLEPLGYGLTNLALVGAGMALIVLLARVLGMAWPWGLLAAGLWGLNPHGIASGVLWISGRTSLLLTAFALAAGIAFAAGRAGWAALACLLALLCKEEAVLLPAVLAAWAVLLPADGASRTRALARRGAILLLPLAAYLLLRSRTAAYLPWSAPGFYRPTLSPAALARNALEYADRACTLAAAAVLLASALLGRWPRPDARERRWLALGLIWLAGGYGLTVFLPVRSSLYAVFPSAGAALAAAALGHAAWRAAPPARRRRVLLAAALAPLALVPLLWSRNARLVRTARLSARALAAIAAQREGLAAGRLLVLHDAPDARPNLASAFGTLLPEAVRLATGLPDARAWLEPPPPDWQAAGLQPPAGEPRVELGLLQGDVRPLHGGPGP